MQNVGANCILSVLIACCSVPAIASNVSDLPNDNVLHTSVFHTRNHQTLEFLVTFGVGYGDVNHCRIVKQRVFTATHADGYEAHNYGRYLAKEYGPELFTCVNEKLHVIGSSYPDENMTYALINNGEYYIKAIPDRHDVYPR